jgi:hypothetical protein
MCNLGLYPPPEQATATSRPTTVAEYVAAAAAPRREVADALCALVGVALPDAEARLWQGHPAWWLGGRPVVLLEAHPRHVTLAFGRGQDLADPAGRLQPGAGRTASVTVGSLDELGADDAGILAAWLLEAGELERAARS